MAPEYYRKISAGEGTQVWRSLLGISERVKEADPVRNACSIPDFKGVARVGRRFGSLLNNGSGAELCRLSARR